MIIPIRACKTGHLIDIVSLNISFIHEHACPIEFILLFHNYAFENGFSSLSSKTLLNCSSLQPSARNVCTGSCIVRSRYLGKEGKG